MEETTSTYSDKKVEPLTMASLGITMKKLQAYKHEQTEMALVQFADFDLLVIKGADGEIKISSKMKRDSFEKALKINQEREFRGTNWEYVNSLIK